ncbi:AAA family ATPase [Pedobacter metabolipauper]|uniref:AAA domain-containing protein n=1 Tax=Pedobacter metabolipauper TaxID=425513 RepID=A0A4R6SYB4_9SPHI|nr:AAA family ATPase [Pedobacter metabolipauper]TDQ11012.1 AAA domain-containing protein [Pedobacter metabolipauper]
MKKIKSIEVRNSRFYQDFRIEFSDKLTCIMGGRGTGKTTLLNFMKVALGYPDFEDKQLGNLLRSNLGAGTITLEIQGETNQIYNLVKTLEDAPQSFILPKLDFIPLSKIFNDIECDFYEAGRIEEIGRSSRDRLALIDKKIKNEISVLMTSMKNMQIELESNALDIKSFSKKIKQFDDVLSQYSDVELEFETFKKQKPLEIGETENKTFEDADRNEGIRLQETRFYNRSVDVFKKFQKDLVETYRPLKNFIDSETQNPEVFQNSGLMKEAQELMTKTVEDIRQAFGKVAGMVKNKQNDLDISFSKLIDIHTEQQASFVTIKQQFDQNREYINKYNLLSKRITDKSILMKDQDDMGKRLKQVKEVRSQLLERLNEYKKSIFGLRLKTVNELNQIFNNEVVITLTYAGIRDDFQEKLRSALKGSGIQYNVIVLKIAERFTPEQFAQVVHDRNASTLMSIKEIDQTRALLIISTLYETELLYEIETMYCDDLPEFKLKIASDSANLENNYRRTDELSMGQRCTTVLPIIFAVSTNPLIIDQPEDNLDNKYITQSIHETIRQQKTNRQLIFITHNPNIPVLSDADHNIFLEYENRQSKILHEGTILEVKQDIINLLEGGALAFERRMETYGYENNL